MEATIIILCLLLSAFFSGMEIAYVASNKVYLSVEKKQENFISKLLTRLTENPTQFITSMLIGNSIALVVYGYHMGNIVLRWFDLSAGHFVWQLLLQVTISCFVILLTAEFIPKVLFQVYANTLIKALAVPAYIFYMLFKSVSKVIMVVSDFFLVTLFRTKARARKDFFSRHELDNYVTEQLTGENKQDEVDSEIQIFKNALDFSGLKAVDIMTPRTEIAAVEINDGVEVLKELFVDTGYSKILIYHNSVSEIVGHADSFTLFKKPQTIQEVLIPVEYVPEDILVKDLLSQLTRKRRSIAVVLDQYGSTAGLITLEDIIEELFGEIEDEHDDELLTEEALPSGGWLFSARLDVDYLNKTYNLNIVTDAAFTTLGGLMFHFCDGVIKEGQRVEQNGYAFITEKVLGKRAELIKVVLLVNE